MGWHSADVADECSIPEDFACVSYGRDKEFQIHCRAEKGRNLNGSAIPRKAVVGTVALLIPRFIGRELMPMGIVKTGRGPCRIVSDLKLPRAVERERSFSKAFK